MSGLITLVWLIQSLWLFAVSALCLFTPRWFSGPMSGGAAPVERMTTMMTCYEMRLLVPLTFGIALFSSVAAMREDERVRRRMAGSFALLLAFCDGLFVLHHQRGLLGDGAAAVATVGIVLQAVYALWPQVVVIPPRLSGTANTQPPALWALWMAQGFGFIALGVCLVLVPWEQWARLEYIARPVPRLATTELIQDLRGMFYVGLGLFSFHATSLEMEWHWRLYSGIFALIAGVAGVVTCLFWSPDVHTSLVLLPIVPLLAVLVGNLRFWRRHRDPIGEEIGHGPDGWTVLDIPSGPFLAIQSLFYRRRSTHLMGVGASGSFTVVDSPQVPEHGFFVPGSTFPLQARFATLTSRDDACCDIRGAAIRLSGDVSVPSPFDMLMNSGSISGPSDMVGFTAGVFSRFLPRYFFNKAVRDDLQTREALIAGRRRAPECYSTVHFYSQIVRFWVGKDHVRRLVRYRLVNPSRPETGIPDALDCKQIWLGERRRDERRPSDYLRTALKRRLAGKEPVTLHFEAQFHRPEPGDTLDWYNAAVDWPCDGHPWLTVAVVTLTAPLPDEETECLRFNAANHPPSLGIPSANGMYDFRSLGDAERRVIRRLATYRLKMYEILGLPRFGNTLPNEHGRR